MNNEEQEAHRILDLWKAGADESDGITLGLVNWCLRVTGDAIQTSMARAVEGVEHGFGI